MEYEELGWFLNEAFKIKDKKETEELLRIAEAVRMGTIGASSKENLDVYRKWSSDLKEKIKPGESGEGKTLFDKLKMRKPAEAVKTLFDKLKGG